jgi:hypothetical protein
MTEENLDFDVEVDYFEKLKSSEKWTDTKSGREYPYFKGLARLAHTYRRGVKSVRSKIVKAPCVNSLTTLDSEGEAITNAPDCIAAVTVSYEFNDGTIFEGSADASFKAHVAPFNLHLTAVAESKAASRAIRSAFMISNVAKEEIGDASMIADDSNDPISDAQIEAIRNLAKRKKLSKAVVLKMSKSEAESIEGFTKSEATLVIKAINRKKAAV